jgi:Squalene-hopene cyclase C-terminal domain/Prenyltransferase and squalene oxidase repeat
MNYQTENIIEILRDPFVKSFFLEILQNERASPEDKYNKFLSFFESDKRLQECLQKGLQQATTSGKVLSEQTIARLVSKAAQRAGLWEPKSILEHTQKSLVLAIEWILSHQNSDGGWGYSQEEGSKAWGTAYALLSLKAAQGGSNIFSDTIFASIEPKINQGVAWMKHHENTWCIRDIPTHGGKSIYDASVSLRSLHRASVPDFEQHLGCIRKIADAQNSDGGWDANIYGSEFVGEKRVWSAVGATSMALQALVATGEEQYKLNVKNAIHWLARTQNENGSWNDKSCTSESGGKIEGNPGINNTCDGITGLLCHKAFKMQPWFNENKFNENIQKAVKWLLEKEQILASSSDNSMGWGYRDEPNAGGNNPDLVSTCLIVESLMGIEDSPLPALTINMQWIINLQDSSGSWMYGDTFRITFAMINFYNTIINSPLFVPVNSGE